MLAVHHAFAILAAHGSGKHLLGTQRLNGMQNFGLLIAHRVGVKRNRRLHGGQGDQLHDVIRHHVAQRTGCVVIAAAMFDADGFRHRDLHVIDVAAIPDGLENAVGEAESQNVLDGLFAQVMIDAINLVFVRNLQQLLVQRLGGFEIVAERLFDDDATPMLASLFCIRPTAASCSTMVRRNRAPWRGNK